DLPGLCSVPRDDLFSQRLPPAKGLTDKTWRLKLHDGKLIKDRRYHLRTYPNCFVAQELIDWLVSHKEALDRATAVCLMQHLMDHDIVHHGERVDFTGRFLRRT
uniref:DEP domain-containing protein n=1 Tax=Fundulus heteroclitus TaxID=8078 RepID=A0A3Q2NRM7_FUNHE